MAMTKIAAVALFRGVTTLARVTILIMLALFVGLAFMPLGWGHWRGGRAPRPPPSL
jgi:hypothetical protein